MALNYSESESEDYSKVSSDSLEDHNDLASKFKSNLPQNKSKKPKRNRSAFIIFSSETRSKIRSEQKEKLNSNEMMTKLANLWRDLPEDQKRKYHEIAEKEKVKYLLELNSFYQTFPYEVVQNKTKKNHVKKPCSAYALYLKEMKKKIKEENSSLKMADILKLVGERWKNLSEEEKAVYQDQANVEKEQAKVKMNEHMLRDIEDLKKAPIPQKRVQSHKRIQKALMKENAKLSASGYDLMQDLRTKVEEPNLRKQLQKQSVMGMSGPNYYDFEMPALQGYYNPSIVEKPALESLNMWSRQESNDPELEKEASFLMSLYDTTNKIAKKKSELIYDLLTFQSKQDSSAIESTVNCTANAGARGNNAVSTRQMMNDTLINCLSFEPHTEFNFDSLNNEANFDDILQYWN